MTQRWDAKTYDEVARPHRRWGQSLVDRAGLAGDEIVLDAGCGSGRLTELVIDRLPRGRVIALDASPEMLAEASRRLGHAADRVRFVQADLGDELTLGEQVDVVVSSAAFHWVDDHRALYRNLAGVLRPGGRLVAQYGGAGNIASVVAALDRLGWGSWSPWRFHTPEEARVQLTAAGFEVSGAWLEPDPVRFDGVEQLRTFLQTVVLGAHLARLREADRPQLAEAVAAALDEPVLDYVRLNVVARRSSP